MASHQKETKRSYLRREGITTGIKVTDVNNKSSYLRLCFSTGSFITDWFFPGVVLFRITGSLIFCFRMEPASLPPVSLRSVYIHRLVISACCSHSSAWFSESCWYPGVICHVAVWTFLGSWQCWVSAPQTVLSGTWYVLSCRCCMMCSHHAIHVRVILWWSGCVLY